jgi:hypothetical protein
MWTMTGTYNYLLYTNDTDFLLLNWAKYKHTLAFIYAKVQLSGLLNTTGTRDWARWQIGCNNSEASHSDMRTTTDIQLASTAPSSQDPTSPNGLATPQTSPPSGPPKPPHSAPP